MQFKEISFPGILSAIYLPEDISLALPQKSQLPLDQQHFLLYIPWQEKYLKLIPPEFQNFFETIKHYLQVRTTDVHVAISSSYLDLFLSKFNEPINRRVVALALFLHDSGWSCLSEEEIANSLGVKGLKLSDLALKPKEKHAVLSEKISRKVLNSYKFEPPLFHNEIELICKAVLYHDRPEEVMGAKMPVPIEIKILADLDHLWSFTYENFWQDTVRKGVSPGDYIQNLANDLDSYFLTNEGKLLAKELLVERSKEVELWELKKSLNTVI